MSINLHKIKKWTLMILGKSHYHVNQDEGKYYSIDKIEGYYNNLTEKITKFGLESEEVPMNQDDDGYKRFFSIAIFQYGLAAYDLWLSTKKTRYLNIFKNCVEWAMENQLDNGAWESFKRISPDNPYSAMAQGEGISLLTRAFIQFKDDQFLKAAKKAYRFLLTDLRDNGVCVNNESNLLLYEFPNKPLILNGWIFAAWGILDYYKATKDEEALKNWEKTIRSIEKKLPEFDYGYWSKYNTKKNLTSPFYHKLHIAQLRVLYQLTQIETFKSYADKWEKQFKNPLNKSAAFMVKSIQKILE